MFIGGISGTVGRLLINTKCLSACSSRTHTLGVVHAQHAECVITKECLMNIVLGHNMFWTSSSYTELRNPGFNLNVLASIATGQQLHVPGIDL